MRDLRGIGLREYMPKFIEQLLKNRTVKARLTCEKHHLITNLKRRLREQLCYCLGKLKF